MKLKHGFVIREIMSNHFLAFNKRLSLVSKIRDAQLFNTFDDAVKFLENELIGIDECQPVQIIEAFFTSEKANL